MEQEKTLLFIKDKANWMNQLGLYKNCYYILTKHNDNPESKPKGYPKKIMIKDIFANHFSYKECESVLAHMTQSLSKVDVITGIYKLKRVSDTFMLKDKRKSEF